MADTRTLCVHCEDPGPTRMCVEIARELELSGISCAFYAAGLGASILRGERIPYLEDAPPPSPTSFEGLLYSTVESQTSKAQLFCEQFQKHDLPAISVVDATVGAERRFLRKGRAGYQLPDFAIIFDPSLKPDFLRQGIPEERILFAADPLERRAIRAKEALLATSSGQKLKESLFPEAGDRPVLLLVSDGSRALYQRLGRSPDLGSDPWLVTAQKAGLKQGYWVVLRPHPKDQPSDYAAFPIPLQRDLDPLPGILAANLVLGSGSKLLEEALWMGKDVASVESLTGNAAVFAPIRLGQLPLFTTKELETGALLRPQKAPRPPGKPIPPSAATCIQTALSFYKTPES